MSGKYVVPIKHDMNKRTQQVTITLRQTDRKELSLPKVQFF